MTTTIVIPQRGKDELTEGLVKSIHRHERWRRDVEFVIVNDHPDRDVEKCIEYVADRIVHTRGAGFTVAANAGIETAADGPVVLLNNDVWCDGPFLDLLCGACPDGLCGPEIRHDPDLDDLVLQGWCLAFPKWLWSDLGKFDESMRLYFSDTDFQARARKARYRWATVEIPLRHIGHQTAHDPTLCPDRRHQWEQDRRTFLAKRKAVTAACG